MKAPTLDAIAAAIVSEMKQAFAFHDAELQKALAIRDAQSRTDLAIRDAQIAELQQRINALEVPRPREVKRRSA